MDQPLVRTSLIFTSALVGGVVSPLAGVPLPLDKLVEGLFAQHDANQRKKLRAFGHSMAEELAVIGPKDEGTRNAVCLTIETAIQRFPITHRRLVELNLDPDAATAELLPRLTFGTASDRTELEHWCKTLIRCFYEKLPRHADVLAELLPASLAELLKRQAETQAAIVSVKDDTEQLLSGQQQLLELLEQEKGIPHAALLNHLIRLGADPAIEQSEVPAFLERFAAGYVETREQLSRPSNADQSLTAARDEALALLDAGDLNGARNVFRDAIARRREMRHGQDREEAALLADAARVEWLDLRYRDAATLLAEAADLTAFDPQTSWRHRLAQADALHDQGSEFGDDDALAEAIATYREALTLAPRETRSDDWGTTQNNFGNALQTAGWRESGTTSLKRAVEVYKLALEERSRKRVPLSWAMTQKSLGSALLTLGSRERSTTLLEHAVEVYELALKEYTRESMPLNWAHSRHELAGALEALALHIGEPSLLRKAIQAMQDAALIYAESRLEFWLPDAESSLARMRAELANLNDKD